MVSVTPGSPADVAGILPKDVLVSVNNRDLKNLPLAEAKLILAELGPEVRKLGVLSCVAV